MNPKIASRSMVRRGAEEGATAVEAAIILSVLLVLIAGIVEFAYVYWISNSMLLAAEAAGRSAMVNDTACAAALAPAGTCSASAAQQNAIQAAQQNLPSLGGSPFTVTATEQPSATLPGTTTMTITVNYTADFLGAALMTGGAVTLTRQVTVPLI